MEPDHTGLQLLTLQRVLRTMLAGKLPGVATSWHEKHTSGATDQRVKGAQQLMESAVVWVSLCQDIKCSTRLYFRRGHRRLTRSLADTCVFPFASPFRRRLTTSAYPSALQQKQTAPCSMPSRASQHMWRQRLCSYASARASNIASSMMSAILHRGASAHGCSSTQPSKPRIRALMSMLLLSVNASLGFACAVPSGVGGPHAADEKGNLCRHVRRT
jgi:hypothetical protein